MTEAADKPVRVDAYGDPLPPGARARLGSLRLRHGHYALAVAFSRDGKTLASVGWDHSVRLWDVSTGAELRSLAVAADRANPYAQSRWLYCVAISPDGKVLAAGEHTDGWRLNGLRLWDVASGQQLLRLEGHTGGVLAVAFAPDGKTLASASMDCSVRLWDRATGKQVLSLDGHEGPVRSVAFSPDGRRLATTGDDGTVRVWDAERATELLRLTGHDGVVEAVCFSTDGKTLGSAGRDGTVRLWSAEGKETAGLTGHQGEVRGVSFAPDGKMLASAGRDRSIRLWDAATGKELRRLEGHGDEVRQVIFTADGKMLASASFDQTIRLWDPAAGKELLCRPGHRQAITSLRYSGDGKLLFSLSRDQTVRTWDALRWLPLRAFPAKHHIDRDAAIGPDGIVGLGSRDGDILVQHATTGKEIRRVKGHTGEILSLAVSGDGKLMASGGADSSLRLWEIASGKELRRFVGQPSAVSHVLFSPDGKLLVSQSTDYIIRIWETTTGKPIRELPRHAAVVGAVAISPDNQLLASGGRTGTVHVWQLSTGRELPVLTGLAGWVSSVHFSPDGRTLAAGSWQIIKVWELASQRERCHFTGCRGDAMSMAFSPDSRSLAAGAGDTSILVWDLTGGRLDGPRGPELAAKDLDSLWQDLAAEDASRATRALWTLVANPAQSVSYLQKHLKPSSVPDARRLARLIADLDHDDFEIRQKATQELAQLGTAAAPALRRALTTADSAELKGRVQRLLDRLDKGLASGARLAELRAIEVLEQIGNDQCRRVLEGLGQGPADSSQAGQAKAALRRLAERSADKH